MTTASESPVPVLQVSAAEIQAAIAAAIISRYSPAGTQERIGSIRLFPHQRRSLDRVLRAISTHGGALLADAVGRGKTYVALAAARHATRPLVVAPAVLVGMWTRALAAAGVRGSIETAERLSRGLPGGDPHDFVIVDEAHHFRNRATQRFGRLRGLCSSARVLLLSATPIHNSPVELATILSLFLGSRAFDLDRAALAEHVIRDDDDEGRLPSLGEPRWLELPSDEATLDRICDLPPPVPLADGGEGGALLTFSLLRQWSSSRAALRAALLRRLLRAEAIADSIRQGRHPTRSDIAAWTIGDGAVQLCFAGLLSDRHETPHPPRPLAEAVGAHAEAVRSLLRLIDSTADPDERRARLLREIVARHKGERVIAFASFSETVHALHDRLVREVRCCALDGSGARVAGGRMNRREALERFAPQAHGCREPPEAEQIDLLLTTDILSEGCNLQDASVVVHLDLPWTPARLEQRVGRACRLGSRHERVAVYLMRPPAHGERILQVEERLRRKLAASMRSVGVSGAIVPSLVRLDAPAPRSPAEATARLIRWAEAQLAESRSGDGAVEMPDARQRSGDSREGPRAPVRVAALASPVRGWVAVVDWGEGDRIVASRDGDRCTGDPTAVTDLLELLGDEVAVPSAAVEAALACASEESRRMRSAGISGLDDARLARARRRLLRRLSLTAGRVPQWRRTALTPLFVAGHRIATQVLPSGAERVLDELAVAPLEDEAWLRAVAAFTDVHSRGQPDRIRPYAIRAMLMLFPDSGRRGV